ncbi:MAG: complex I NDUFA9 subunit family protein [Thiotrichaceae bacterium]|nr:complex I NDUFA9 subunit family protein [Thiotrichaceae bacterium]
MYPKVAATHNKIIAVLGGTGFVGQHLVRTLIEAGYQVRVLARHRERCRELLVLPRVSVIDTNIMTLSNLHKHFAGCSAVINLVAVLNESKKGAFQRLHVDLPRMIIDACVANKIERVIHMSALNAYAGKAPSRYLTSKGEGEDTIHTGADEGINVTSLRPSVIFGPGDNLFNRFASLLKCITHLPLACPNARFAPVYVNDVVDVIVKSLNKKATFGQRYDLCGPRAYTLQQLLEFTIKTQGINRKVIPLGNGMSKVMARIMGMMPGKLFTYDNYLSMQIDSVSREQFPAIFNITPQPLEAIVPRYLMNQNQRGQFDRFRLYAGRDN